VPLPLKSPLARWLLARWYGRRPIAPLLPLSWLFVAATALRRILYRRGLWRAQSLPVPVIVVGNLVVGGAGKTPVVAAVATALRAAGWRPGIVSRGYGGSWRSPGLVRPTTRAEECGDEALLLARELGVPVVVGRVRVAAGRLLLAAHPELDCLICDDGLQHYALVRDIELVVIDAARGFGNACLLPAGPLRESVARLHSVDAVLVHGQERDAEAGRRLQEALEHAPTRFALTLVMADPVPLSGGSPRPWIDWRGEAVHAVAGIAHPERFFAGLGQHGLKVTPHAFPDHHPFRPGELSFVGSDPVLLTGKDAVKCDHMVSTRYWVVPFAARLPPAFLPWLIHLLETAHGRKNP
jgi:tetraacyldisaccharide 4'-kinase